MLEKNKRSSDKFTMLLQTLHHTSTSPGTALFWVITQRVLVISYRRFGTTYRSHLQGSSSWPLIATLEDGTWDVVPKCL